MRIVFAGSVAYDYLMTFPGYFKDNILADNLERLSLSFLVDSMNKYRGGVAPNIAYSHALLNGKATVLAAVGADFGDYGSWMRDQNIDTSGVKIFTDVFTASFFCNTDQGNSQIASFSPGAMSNANQCKIADLDFTPDLVVISPDDPAAMLDHVRECKALGIPYVYDPSQQIVRVDPAELKEGVEGAHMLIVNDYEFELLNDKLGITVESVTEAGTILAITLGENGAVVYADGEKHEAKAFPPNAIKDPTGAGDAWRGGFLRGYAMGLPWTLCAEMGALTATYVLEQQGTQNHNYTISEYVQRFRTQFDDGGKLNALDNSAINDVLI